MSGARPVTLRFRQRAAPAVIVTLDAAGADDIRSRLPREDT